MRVQGLLVVLAEDVTLDRVQPTLDAIRQIKGVRDVQPVEADADTQIARVRERGLVLHELHNLATKYAQRTRDGETR